jgi:hypothetical protein
MSNVYKTIANGKISLERMFRGGCPAISVARVAGTMRNSSDNQASVIIQIDGIAKGLCDYNLENLSGICRATHLISTFAFSGSVFTATHLQTEKFYRQQRDDPTFTCCLKWIDSRPCRLMCVVSPILPISDVHLCKVCNVAQKDIDFNGMIQTRSGFFKHCLQVCNALVLGTLLVECAM